MKMNEQCRFCVHNTVCAYKEHYEDAVKLYEKARAECAKYPWFKCRIECTQYRRDSAQGSIEKIVSNLKAESEAEEQ